MQQALSNRLFRDFAVIAYELAGIHLGVGKEALVEARIAKRVRALGLSGPAQYLECLTSSGAEEELANFLDAISTNYTRFFREPDHFALLAELVESRLRQGQRRFRFWSAASSSGEEPYTMALTVHEALRDTTDDWQILGTDISRRMLAIAREGCYSKSSLESVPTQLLHRYFAPISPRGTENPIFRVNEELRSHVAFRRLNLADPPFPMRGPFDAVFCRNVMIYFDQRVRQGLISAIEKLIGTDGRLFIGHSETLHRVDTRFRHLQPSVYSPC